MKRLVGLLHSSGQSSAEPDVTAHPTPIWISKRTRTALILAVVIVLGFVIWYVPSVFTTVVGGFALALALSFPVSAVQERLTDLAQSTGADEIMVTTMVHDHRERLRSYGLLAQAFGFERVPLEQATGE